MIKILKSPFDLVSEALETKRESVTKDSAMGEHPNWDSLNHLAVIVAIEKNYGISIPDADLMKYDNMKTIIKLFEDKSGISPTMPLLKRVKQALKKTVIGKIFFK